MKPENNAPVHGFSSSYRVSAVGAQPLTSATLRPFKVLAPLTAGTPPEILVSNPAGLFNPSMLRENSMKRGLWPLVCV